MDIHQLKETAKKLVSQSKGILAADESNTTIKKRFDSLGIESTVENRRKYREMLFTTPGIEKFISGVIMYDETIRQETDDGVLLVSLLKDRGIIPGVKVDIGVKDLPFAPGEKITEGLDGLSDKLKEYSALGVRFAKWRAVITIASNLPSQYCVEANAHALARYAAVCQEMGIVPIVEPEVMMDGHHDIDHCQKVTETTLGEVYRQLKLQRVNLRGTLLKPNMVLSGKEAKSRATAKEVGRRTVDTFIRVIPDAVPGIVFLSGGQGDNEATINLASINQYALEIGVPWELSFSYGRGLQASPLKTWRGVPTHIKAAQKSFYNRAMLTSAARQGEYASAMENQEGVSNSLS